MDDIKDCPLCGGGTKLIESGHPNTGYAATIRCRTCGCEVSGIDRTHEDVKNKILSKWNKRV